MFDLERFAEECRAALAHDRGGPGAVREVVARAVSDPADLMRALGEPHRGEVQKLHHAPDLTILNVVWGPRMTIMPHNHRMWAVIGIYTGREDNIFWRRVGAEEDGAGHRLAHRLVAGVRRDRGAAVGDEAIEVEHGASSRGGPGVLSRRQS